MSDLDDLFAEAIAQIRPPVRRHGDKRKLPDPDAIDPRALYTNPSNWRQGRGIALIHEETSSLLGTFQEYLHTSEPGTRRLVLTSAPIPVSATERVSGDWWISAHHEVASPQSWHERRTVILPISLDLLGVQSPLVEISVHLSYGSIARIELVEATTFAQIAGQPDQLLELPAGANILPVMGQDSKIAVRVELGKGEVV